MAVFDPIKKEVGGKLAEGVIWSTEALLAAVDGLAKGLPLKANPFLEGDINYLKDNLVYDRTQDEVDDFIECMGDILHFARKCHLKTAEGGIRQVTLRDYQEVMLELFSGKRTTKKNVIVLTARQTGKTTTAAIALLWFALFSYDKNIFVCSNKRKSATEIISKIKEIYQFLPYHLKPGTLTNNQSEMMFDNGCRILSDATTKNTGIGFTVNVLYLDEFAHVEPNIAEAFYQNIAPTLSATGDGRMMITSTQNGYNLFSRLFKSAQAGDNDFEPYIVDWHQVPEWNKETKQWEKRDEKWRLKTIANLGSADAFEMQYGTSFDISGNTLLNINFIKTKRREAIIYKYQEINSFIGNFGHEHFYWHPMYDTGTLQSDFIVILCDLAEGIGKDYTVFNIFKYNEGILTQIGYFRSNTISLRESSSILWNFSSKCLHNERHLISIEYNTYGELFNNYIREKSEKTEQADGFDDFVIVKYKNGEKYRNGIKMTKDTKQYGCISIKELLEKRKVEFYSEIMIAEAEVFCNNGNDTFEATYGHDDMFMTSIQIPHLMATNQYREFISEYEISKQIIPKHETYNLEYYPTEKA